MKTTYRYIERNLDQAWITASSLSRSHASVTRAVPEWLSKRKRIVCPSLIELSISPGAPNIGTNCACLDEFTSNTFECILTSTTGTYVHSPTAAAEIAICKKSTHHFILQHLQTDKNDIRGIPAATPMLRTRLFIPHLIFMSCCINTAITTEPLSSWSHSRGRNIPALQFHNSDAANKFSLDSWSAATRRNQFQSPCVARSWQQQQQLMTTTATVEDASHEFFLFSLFFLLPLSSSSPSRSLRGTHYGDNAHTLI